MIQTEIDWLSCTNPSTMRSFMDGKASDRKLRLMGCARYRRHWELLSDSAHQLVELSERFADGEVTWKQMKASWKHARSVGSGFHGIDCIIAQRARPGNADLIAHLLARHRRILSYREMAPIRQEQNIIEARTICDIFGNPFRPVTLDPAWLPWNDGTIPKLAQAIYDERQLPSGHLDAGRLAILADALEEAGCTNADILGHCRSPGPHVRGCWVVDLLLGKE